MSVANKIYILPRRSTIQPPIKDNRLDGCSQRQVVIFPPQSANIISRRQNFTYTTPVPVRMQNGTQQIRVIEAEHANVVQPEFVTDTSRAVIDVEEAYRLIEESSRNRKESEQPRRRERLNHLTPEEKLNRRKQKNR